MKQNRHNTSRIEANRAYIYPEDPNDNRISVICLQGDNRRLGLTDLAVILRILYRKGKGNVASKSISFAKRLFSATLNFSQVPSSQVKRYTSPEGSTAAVEPGVGSDSEALVIDTECEPPQNSQRLPAVCCSSFRSCLQSIINS